LDAPGSVLTEKQMERERNKGGQPLEEVLSQKQKDAKVGNPGGKTKDVAPTSNPGKNKGHR